MHTFTTKSNNYFHRNKFLLKEHQFYIVIHRKCYVIMINCGLLHIKDKVNDFSLNLFTLKSEFGKKWCKENKMKYRNKIIDFFNLEFILFRNMQKVLLILVLLLTGKLHIIYQYLKKMGKGSQNMEKDWILQTCLTQPVCFVVFTGRCYNAYTIFLLSFKHAVYTKKGNDIDVNWTTNSRWKNYFAMSWSILV